MSNERNDALMPPRSAEHCLSVASRASSKIVEKYIAGQAEHGGYLPDKFTALELAKEALAEAIDQVIYLETLVDKLEAAG